MTVGTTARKESGRKRKQAGIWKAEINGNKQWERSTYANKIFQS